MTLTRSRFLGILKGMQKVSERTGSRYLFPWSWQVEVVHAIVMCKKRAIRRALMRLGSLSDVISPSCVMTPSRSFVIIWRRHDEHDLVPLQVFIHYIYLYCIVYTYTHTYLYSYPSSSFLVPYTVGSILFFSHRSWNHSENIPRHKMKDPWRIFDARFTSNAPRVLSQKEK